MKKAIEYLLDHGGYLKLPYKDKLSHWFSEIGVSLGKTKEGKYEVFGNVDIPVLYDTLEEALHDFANIYAQNAGAIQEYVRMKKPEVEENFDIDWNLMKKLVRNERAKRKRLEKKHGYFFNSGNG